VGGSSIQPRAVGADLAIALRPASFKKVVSFAPQAFSAKHPPQALALCRLRKLSFHCMFEFCEEEGPEIIAFQWMVIAR
jgi:hypothetical protein